LKNLVTRALTGIVFVAAVVGAICFDPIAFALLFALFTALAVNEFHSLVEAEKTSKYWKLIQSLGGVYLFGATFLSVGGYCSVKVMLPYVLFTMFMLIRELYARAESPIQNWAIAVLGQIYAALPFALMNFILFRNTSTVEAAYSPIFLLALFSFIWVNDTGAYIVGSRFGKHRLFERVSPKKSWEGFYGGLFFACIASFGFHYFAPHIHWAQWMGFATVVVVFGTWGDLTESLLKRTIGVKDSGNILPGHGGLLDRFDSVMMATPAAWIYIELFIR
jgi:phosphatidate cytidylyltransferase